MPSRGLSRSILTRREARDLYNRRGARREGFAFYAGPAVERLIEHGDFRSAAAVVEFGCGTGALAQRLMEEELPIYAGYTGFDLADEMVRATRQRLLSFGVRVSVKRTDGRPRVPLPPHSCDRFVSTYVLDLMTSQDIASLLSQAWTVLRPGGLLCLVSLSSGGSSVSKLVMTVWTRVHAARPALVGGCRPISLGSFLGPASWKILYSGIVTSKAIPSEVLIARPRAHAEPGPPSSGQPR
jgi:SAM-dependent methyltransferase